MMKPMLKIAVITGATRADRRARVRVGGEPARRRTALRQRTGTTHLATPANPGNPTPGPKAGLPAQAKAYGRYCNEQNASKKHVKGEQGTEFSRCVKAMAKAANEDKTNPPKPARA